MSVDRDDVPNRVSAILGGRVVRWLPIERQIGDYDSRDRTLEVFDVEASEQRPSLRALRGMRPILEAAAGGSLIVVFHTPGESRRLYSDVVAAVAARRVASPG